MITNLINKSLSRFENADIAICILADIAIYIADISGTTVHTLMHYISL